MSFDAGSSSMLDQDETTRSEPHHHPIAVIGAGFSGTMAAVQLLARLPQHQSVLLCERAERFGSGRAYATGNPDHLLNVRAANMSAYPDRPSHFEDWLSGIGEGAMGADAGDPAPRHGRDGIRRTPAGIFAARGLYGDYLAGILTDARTGGTPPRLHLFNDMIIDIVPNENRLVLVAEGGQRVEVAGAVLAMGNLAPPQEPPSRFRVDPWRPEQYGRLHPGHPVLIIGTGLSMVDAAISLRRHGFSGQIVALSRRGQIPAVHARADPWPRPDFTTAETRSITRLLGRIRREVACAAQARIGWHGVIDALRPVTDALWIGLPPADKLRFLRHLRPFWDTHRHRAAPPVGAAIAREIEAGSLQVLAGKLMAIEDQAGEARVTYRPRGASELETLDVQLILDVRGVGRVVDTSDLLLRNLIGRGLVQAGPFGLGLAVRPDLTVVGAADTATRLWTLGPMLRGAYWECTAVPDIRNQAVDLARSVAALH